MATKSLSRSLLPALLLALSVGTTSCQSMLQGLAPTFRTTEAGSHIHAWATSQWTFTNADLNNAQWVSTLDKVDREAVPFLEAMRKGGHVMSIEILPHESGPGGEIETYEVKVTVRRSDGEAHVLPGEAGTDPGVYAQALEPAAKDLGMDPQVLQNGHFAIYAMVNMMTAINASNHIIESRAFALLVLQEKIKNGEKADYLDMNRPASETLEDIDASLRLVAQEHARIASARAEVLAMTALAASYPKEGAIDLFKAQVRESRQRAQAWRDTNPRPTLDDFGVRIAQLPTPDKMLDDLKERAGFMGAVVQIAKGVVTGSPSATLDGIAKLAPKDSTARVALEGLSAAASGDVAGTADAMIKLSGKEADVSELRGRIDQVSGAASHVR